MIKNIIVQPSGSLSIVTEYFDFNRIPYQLLDLWCTEDDEFGGYKIPNDLLSSVDNLLILNHSTFQAFFDWDVGKEQLIQFSKKNQIWLWNDLDGVASLYYKLIPLIEQTNNIQSSNITIFVDGPLTSNPQTLNVQVFPANPFLKMPRIHLGSNAKINCKYDFLLTTIIKPSGLHRKILINDLFDRNLQSNGIISKNTPDNKNSQWIGDTPQLHDWKDGYPSMDLYRQCWFEIVPETMYQHMYFYTEKTNKPIATKTPFLSLSTKGYLEYLQSLGFKTFDSLIDESYDQQDSIEDRVRFMLDQVEDIISNGSEQFYRASESILEYNYNHLAEITGKWDHLMDAFITQQLERIGFQL